MRTPTVKVVLHKRYASDDHGYIYLHISLPGTGRVAPKSLGYRVKEKEWDAEKQQVKPTNPDHDTINTFITNTVSKHKNSFTLDKLAGKKITAARAKSELKNEGRQTVWQFFESRIAFMKQERKSRTEEKKKYSDNYVKKWETIYHKLKAHTDEYLSFDDITTDWMEGHEVKVGKELNKDTSLPVHMAKLHQMLQQAAKRKLFDIEQIDGYKLPEYKNPPRPYLVLSEIDTIWDNLQENKFTPTENEVAAYFLIECLTGLRFSDWSRFTTEKLIGKNRIKVSAKKNGEPVYLPYDKSPRLKKVIKYIQANDIFFNHAEKTANECLKEIAKKCNIKTYLTTHVGRHTFATLMLELGYSKETIAEWMAVSARTVEIYAKAIRNQANKEYEAIGGL